MKTVVVVIALLLFLAAPCWAQDYSPTKESEVKRLWPGGAFIIVEFIDPGAGACRDGWPNYPSRIIEERVISIPPTKEDRAWLDGKKQNKYEHKIIPEGELESYLNQGWEKVDVYTVYETRRDLQGYEIKGQTYPFNKAIVRRAK